jgi:hypothetical protein
MRPSAAALSFQFFRKTEKFLIITYPQNNPEFNFKNKNALQKKQGKNPALAIFFS